MAFQQGLSGLNASSKSIDVVSNNIANASTVGFKSGSARFADIYAASVNGASSNVQVGIGTFINSVFQSFTQGNPTITSNPLDMAINGNGFFRIQRADGSIAYTRNGQFDANKNGDVITSNGDYLSGFAVSSVINGTTLFEGTPSPIHIDTTPIQPSATQGAQGASVVANLDSRNVRPTLAFDPAADPIPVESYNSTTSMAVYDSLGNQHQLTYYFIRTDPATDRQWSVWASMDGDTPTSLTGDTLGGGGFYEPANPLEFTELGVITNPTAATFNFTRTAAELGNGAADLDFDVNLSKMTQFGEPFAVTALPQNGYGPGQLTGMNVTKDGIVQGTYSNGQTRSIAKLALANFASPNGLISLGNNLWAESSESGQPILGAPGTGVLGVVTSGQVEDSNVDLTAELVNLIIQQRNYQANAQSIRTQDQILQTLVNLR